MAQMQLTPVAVVQLSSAPSSPSAGWVYFDTTLNMLGCYNGTTWLYDSGSASIPDYPFLKLAYR